MGTGLSCQGMFYIVRFYGPDNDWNFTKKNTDRRKKVVFRIGSFPLSAVLMVKGTS